MECGKMSKILINGVLREMTPEDARYFPEVETAEPESDPTEVRLKEIEAALIEMAAMVARGEV